MGDVREIYLQVMKLLHEMDVFAHLEGRADLSGNIQLTKKISEMEFEKERTALAD